MADPSFPCLRVSGAHTYAQTLQRVIDAIAAARDAGAPALMVSLQGIEGFAPPGLAERHRMVREFADAAQGRVRVAMVVPAAFIDREKFGVVAAKNFGLQSDVFTTEGEAAEWLRLHA